VVTVAASVVIAMMVDRAARARHRASFDAAKVELEACLLGPEPAADRLEGTDACSARVRRRQLVAMATPVERRIDEALTVWPMRCSEASRRMRREALELGDVDLEREAADVTRTLATMKALSAPLDLQLCTDAAGRARPAHLSTAPAVSLPALAAPLDLDALVAHGPPSHPAKKATELDFAVDPRLAALRPEGAREVGSIGTKATDAPPKLPEGESMMTDRDWPGVIHLATCRAGTCQKRIVSRETFDLNDPELRASDPERFQPARVGTAVLAVWRAGARGGLRMRVAPIDGLAAAHDTVVFDDLVRDGAVQARSTLEAFRVHGGSREARIFLVTALGTWIVNVSEDGVFALR
jgi:hypothetical protein